MTKANSFSIGQARHTRIDLQYEWQVRCPWTFCRLPDNRSTYQLKQAPKPTILMNTWSYVSSEEALYKVTE